MGLISDLLGQLKINTELNKIKESSPLYAILKTYEPNPNDTIHPANKGIIDWNMAFLMELEWKLFEDVCMEYLRLKNCNAKVTNTGADGGIDIKISDKNGNIIAVAQCKAWKKEKQVGISLIRELYGIMAAEQIKHGIFLTTSIFSNDAKEFAKNKPLILIDGEEFINVINGLEDDQKRQIDKLVYQDDYQTPTCANCNIKMVKRVAKKGNHPGSVFWGCINYPRCKFRLNIRKEH